MGDVLWLNAAGWSQRYPSSPIRLLGASRELLEWKLRTRVASSGAVRFLDGCDVLGLLSSRSGDDVRGVRFRPRPGSSGGQIDKIPAELVLDASGRGSRASQWLAELGYTPP
jgi:hypothetical protein